ncbi:MAG TPA: hypothetical protein VF533_00065 [Solirubrobacteraceae bacterium]|jgi:TolB protein
MLRFLAGALALLALAPAAQAAYPGANGRIVYSGGDLADATGAGDTSYIATRTPAGKRMRVLRSCAGSDPGCEREVSPTYSPDGRWIAFVSGPRLAVMRADGRDVRVLPPLTASDGAPSWSPDGRRLAFEGRGEPEARREVYTVGADGAGLERVTSRGGFSPVWSARGEIAYQRCPPRRTTKVCAVRVVRPDGRHDRLVLRNAGSPSWAPDGRRLAVERVRRSVAPGDVTIDSFQVWTVWRDGHGARRLTRGGGYGPAWSPDGRRIAFGHAEEEDFPLFIVTVRRDGTGRRVIASDPGFRSAFTSRPDWQPLPARPAVPAKRLRVVVAGEVRTAALGHRCLPVPNSDERRCADVAFALPPSVRVGLGAGRTVEARPGAKARRIHYSLEQASRDPLGGDFTVLEEGSMARGEDRRHWRIRPRHGGGARRYLRFFVDYGTGGYAVFYLGITGR